jgi:hypothetical protein
MGLGLLPSVNSLNIKIPSLFTFNNSSLSFYIKNISVLAVPISTVRLAS